MPSNLVDISLILPAYNESKTIQATLREVTDYFKSRRIRYQIIVSADGSDGTREKSLEFAQQDQAVEVIGAPERRGKGRGIREGVAIATGNIIGFADADNKVPITEYEKLEKHLREGCEIVIGSRGLNKSKVERPQPWFRRVGSVGFYYFMRAVVGLPGIEDTQCGFKFFQHHIAKDLFARQRIDGYMYDVEILALAQRSGYQITEIPIRWHDDADSRLDLISGNLKNVRDIFRIRQYCAQYPRVARAPRAKAEIA